MKKGVRSVRPRFVDYGAPASFHKTNTAKENPVWTNNHSNSTIQWDWIKWLPGNTDTVESPFKDSTLQWCHCLDVISSISVSLINLDFPLFCPSPSTNQPRSVHAQCFTTSSYVAQPIREPFIMRPFQSGLIRSKGFVTSGQNFLHNFLYNFSDTQFTLLVLFFSLRRETITVIAV